MFYQISATFSTALRILRQLSHDRRSLLLVFLVPVMLMSLLWWLYSDSTLLFNQIAPALLGIFPFIIMFLITSVTTLRERTDGTLERILITPISKVSIMLGYTLAFGLVAIIQALVVSAVAILFLDMSVAGPNWLLLLVALIDALLGTALGILVSAFAKTEFQAVQFMPALIFPQLLLCGLLLPLGQMPTVLEQAAYYLPLTYAVDALQRVSVEATISSTIWRDIWVVVGFIVVAVILGALTLRRSSK